MPSRPHLPVDGGPQPCLLGELAHRRCLCGFAVLDMTPWKHRVTMAGTVRARPATVVAHDADGRGLLTEEPLDQQNLRSFSHDRDRSGNLHPLEYADLAAASNNRTG